MRFRMQSEMRPAGDQPVAIVPHRGMLWVTSAGNDAHLQILCATAQKEFDDSPRAISPGEASAAATRRSPTCR